MGKIVLAVGVGIVLFGGGVAAGYWAVPLVVANLQQSNTQASPPAGSVDLTDTAAPAADTTTTPSAPTQPAFQTVSLSGRGQQASKVVSLPAGGYRVTMTHDGAGNFIVILDDSQGKQVEMLANQVGKSNISQAVNVPAGNYLFNVGADGNWTIKIEALQS